LNPPFLEISTHAALQPIINGTNPKDRFVLHIETFGEETILAR